MIAHSFSKNESSQRRGKSKVCVKQMRKHGYVTTRVEKLLKWACIAGSLSADNPYLHADYYPHRSLKEAIKALLAGRLFRRHAGK